MAESLTQVVVLDLTSKEDIFVCGLCKSVFNLLELFTNHKKNQCMLQRNLHNITDKVSQHSVPTKFYQNNNKEVSGVYHNNISCTICNRTFKKLKCLYSHLKLHEKPSQCLVCGRCFENTSHLNRHVSTHKMWPDGLNGTTPKSSDAELLSYSCAYCDAVLSNYSHFRAHLNSHLKLKKFKCIQASCNEFFDTVEDLLGHVSIAHITTKYTCYVCKKNFLSLSDIQVHYKNHNNSIMEVKETQMDEYKCTQCDASFRKPEKLSLHLLTESHNKSCIHCKKAFASDKRLRLHLQIHKKSKPFQCDICSRSFHMKKYLTSHMLKHGDRQFVCMVCKHSFKRRDILKRHMRTHALGKLLKCPFRDIDNCTREFNRKDKLRQHLKSHAKHLKHSTCNIKQSENKDSGILEICIVPLDSNNTERIQNEM